MTKLDSILKNRDIGLPTEVCMVRAMVFPVVMYGWEAEHFRIDAFEHLAEPGLLLALPEAVPEARIQLQVIC